MLQILTLNPLADARRKRSKEKATHELNCGSKKVCKVLPVDRSHSLIVMSKLAEANRCVLGLEATAWISLRCPVRTRSAVLSRKSRICRESLVVVPRICSRVVVGPDTTTKTCPSPLKARLRTPGNGNCFAALLRIFSSFLAATSQMQTPSESPEASHEPSARNARQFKGFS